jgi:hypothetical protein
VSDTAETQTQPPSQRVAYQGIWYKPPALAFDESAAIESELVAVGLGVRASVTRSCRDSFRHLRLTRKRLRTA